MAISSENLKLRMFHEITKHDIIYIKHDHRNINQITWLISIGNSLPGEKHIHTVGSVHFQYYDLDNITQARATYHFK